MNRTMIEILAGLGVLGVMATLHHQIARLEARSDEVHELRGIVEQSVAQTDAEFDIAGRQWEKLEAAQQLAVTKVTPLHVNLPTRGIRYSFTQVLQTEINKPMTIGMLAENTKVPSWTLRGAYSLLAFVSLWLAVSLVARRREA